MPKREPIPRLTRIEATILALLVAKRDRYGLELVRESDGAVKRGTVYVILGRMADKGLVSSRVEDDPTVSGMPRRRYSPTGLGERALAAFEARSPLALAWGGAT